MWTGRVSMSQSTMESWGRDEPKRPMRYRFLMFSRMFVADVSG